MRWLLQAAPDATAIVDSAGRIVTMNSQWEELFRCHRDELIGRPVDLLVPERFRAGHPAHRSEYLADPRARSMGAGRNLYAVRSDGTEFAAEISLSSLDTPDGTLVSVGVRDVSERRGIEERFRQFVESAPDAIVISDADGNIVLVNARTEELFGYDRAEIVGAGVEILVPERFRDFHFRHRNDVFAELKVRSMGSGLDLRGRRKNGTLFPIEISLSPMETSGGRLVSSAIRDLSDRMAAEQARRHLATIVDTSGDAIIGLTPDGLITSWNRAAAEIFGYLDSDVIGRSVSTLLYPEQRHELDEMLDILQAGGQVLAHDGIRRRKDGTGIDVSIGMSAIRDSQGVLLGASKVMRDITEHKRTEASLVAAKEAAEVVGQAFEAFSYSVAHDLRAPLRAMDGFSRILLEDFGPLLDDTGRDYLNRLRASSRNMADLIDGLLSLARVSHHDLVRDWVDLSVVATDIADRLQSQAPERTAAVTVQPGLGVHGDAVLLTNVLENLLDNAWKFTSGEPVARIEFGADSDGYFVRDNGAGFDMALSASLFGAFQRLHEAEEFTGTGIGLATVQRIVQRHGGRIWAEAAVEEGATFHFTLPDVTG
jgi:PAS domain S-box-containing protein